MTRLVYIEHNGTEHVVEAQDGKSVMQNALDQLQGARAELQAAATDKGGHRVAAIGIIDQAISEVNEGMRYAATH